MLLGISKMSFKEKSIATTLRTLSARAATQGNRQESQPQLHLGTPQHRMDRLPLGELYLRQLLVGLHLRQPEVLRLLPYPLFLRLHHPQGEVMVLVCGIFFCASCLYVLWKADQKKCCEKFRTHNSKGMECNREMLRTTWFYLWQNLQCSVQLVFKRLSEQFVIEPSITESISREATDQLATFEIDRS